MCEINHVAVGSAMEDVIKMSETETEILREIDHNSMAGDTCFSHQLS